jgi:hypothetical protein
VRAGLRNATRERILQRRSQVRTTTAACAPSGPHQRTGRPRRANVRHRQRIERHTAQRCFVDARHQAWRSWHQPRPSRPWHPDGIRVRSRHRRTRNRRQEAVPLRRARVAAVSMTAIVASLANLPSRPCWQPVPQRADRHQRRGNRDDTSRRQPSTHTSAVSRNVCPVGWCPRTGVRWHTLDTQSVGRYGAGLPPSSADSGLSQLLWGAQLCATRSAE